MAHTRRTQTEFLESDLESAHDTSSRHNGECPICLQGLEVHFPVTTPCGHVYCSHCAHTWFKASNACPDCRTELYDSATIDRTLAGLDRLDLNFDMDDDVLEAAIVRFDSSIYDQHVPPTDLVLVNRDALLVDAVGAAVFLKPDHRGEDFNDAQLCRREWEIACHTINDFLHERDQQCIPADYLHSLLSQALFDNIVWNTSRTRWSQYASGVFSAEEYPNGASFEVDIVMVVSYAVFRAREEFIMRQALANET